MYKTLLDTYCQPGQADQIPMHSLPTTDSHLSLQLRTQADTAPTQITENEQAQQHLRLTAPDFV